MTTTNKIIIRDIKSKPGKAALVWRITRHRITRKVTTSYVISVDEWNGKLQKAVCSRKTSPARKKELEEINEKLQQDLDVLCKAAEMLETDGDYSSQELVTCFQKLKDGQPFCAYIEQIAKETVDNGQFGTGGSYKYAGVSLKKYLGGNDISIDKITCDLIKDYERWLEANCNSKNTISCYMRSLRAIYNRAIKNKIFIADETKPKPFSKVFTGNAKTPKRAAGVEEISRLMELGGEDNGVEDFKGFKGIKSFNTVEAVESTAPDEPAEPKEKKKKKEPLSMSVSLDMFLFCFFAQGMAFVDAANLKKENIRDGFLRYNRKKTGQQITIKLEDRMKAIIDRFFRYLLDVGAKRLAVFQFLKTGHKFL